MKRIAFAAAVLGLLAGAAGADDKVEMKNERDHKVIEKKHSDRGHKSKARVESKSRKRMRGGTVSTTETTQETQRPGMGNDSKTKVNETTERDASGNVVRQEKKVSH